MLNTTTVNANTNHDQPTGVTVDLTPGAELSDRQLRVLALSLAAQSTPREYSGHPSNLLSAVRQGAETFYAFLTA